MSDTVENSIVLPVSSFPCKTVHMLTINLKTVPICSKIYPNSAVECWITICSFEHNSNCVYCTHLLQFKSILIDSLLLHINGAGN